MSYEYPTSVELMEAGADVYDRLALYVEVNKALKPREQHETNAHEFTSGTCSFVADDDTKASYGHGLLLDAFVNANAVTLGFGEERYTGGGVPFNKHGASPLGYVIEGCRFLRLANPHRRAFINWVCRLAGQPELLP